MLADVLGRFFADPIRIPLFQCRGSGFNRERRVDSEPLFSPDSLPRALSPPRQISSSGATRPSAVLGRIGLRYATRRS